MRSLAKTLQLKQISSNFKLTKFSLLLLVVVTLDMWRRQRKTFKKVALVTVYFNNISLVLHRVGRKSTR